MKSHSLLFNSIFNVIYKVLNILFPLVTAAYIARIIESELIGEVAFAQNIAQYFVLLAALGLPNYGTREIAKKRDQKDASCKVFSELLLLNAISTTVCLLVYCILVISIPFIRNQAILFLITGINIILNYINVDWLYQGLEQYRYIAVRSFIVKLFSLFFILVFVRSSTDYLLYALISALALAGNNIYNVLHLKKMGIKFQINNLEVKKHLGPVISLLCTTLAIELYTLLDTTMIGILCTKDNVAFYNYAMRITKSIIAMIAAIGGVLLPRLSYYRGKNDLDACKSIIEKTLDVLIYLLIPSAVGIALCSGEIIPFLYGRNFSQSIPILRISSILVVTLGFSNLFGTQILITFGKENRLLIATVIGAISNICLNSLLIPRFQGVGAAIASVISETLVTIITFCFAKKCITISTGKTNFFVSILSCVVMTGSIFLLKGIVHKNSVLLISEIVTGALLYAIMTFIMKNTVAIDIVNRIIGRLRRHK